VPRSDRSDASCLRQLAEAIDREHDVRVSEPAAAVEVRAAVTENDRLGRLDQPKRLIPATDRLVGRVMQRCSRDKRDPRLRQRRGACGSGTPPRDVHRSRPGSTGMMRDPASTPRRPGIEPPTPSLPDVDSPPPEDVLDSAPSREEIVDTADSADEIIRQQPSVDELLRPDR
jgi:hypothetical protein